MTSGNGVASQVRSLVFFKSKTLAQILAAAKQAFSSAKDADQERIFGGTAQTLSPALAAK